MISYDSCALTLLLNSSADHSVKSYFIKESFSFSLRIEISSIDKYEEFLP